MATITGFCSNPRNAFTFGADWSYTQSITTNQSTITLKPFIKTSNTARTFNTVESKTITYRVRYGASASSLTTLTATASQVINCETWSSNPYYLTSKSFTIPHNSDGSAPSIVYVDISVNMDAYSGGTNYGAGDCSISSYNISSGIPDIARYANTTLSVQSKTETSIIVKWSTDAVIDYIQYSVNGGSYGNGRTVNSTSGTISLTGLTPYTNYTIKVKVRRKDSQLSSESSALATRTYAYPYASSMPDFTIGDLLRIKISNPLAREVTVEILGNDGSTIYSGTTSETSVSGFRTATFISRWYQSIPTSPSGTYSVRVTYSGNTDTRTGGTYSANPSVAKPTASAFSYQDVNSTTNRMTGDNSVIVRNKSLVFYQVTGLAGYEGATISSVSVQVNGQAYSLTVSNGSASGGYASIDSASDIEAVAVITDSRGISGTYSVTVTMLNWTNPTGVVSASRVDNYYSQTDVKASVQWESINGNNPITLTGIAVCEDSSQASVSFTLTNNTTTQISIDNGYLWNITVTATDSLGGSASFTAIVPKGKPIFFIDALRRSVGINCLPESDEALWLNGSEVVIPNVPSAYQYAPCSVTSRKTGNTSSPTTGAYTDLALGSHTVIGDRLSAASTGITVGANVNHVRISAVIALRGSTSNGIRYVQITQNGDPVARASLYMTTATTQTSIVVAPIVVPASQGDVFKLQYETPGGAIYGSSTEALTYMTVEVID